MFRQIRVSLAFFAMLLLSGAAYSQGTTGQISGTVMDQAGAAIPGATVKVTNAGTNIVRETTANDEGYFSMQSLPAGRYSVEASAANFRTTKADADVNITQTTVVDVTLAVGGGPDIEVEVAAPALQTETSQNGRTITGDTIRQLPLPTRNFQQLLTLSPGAQNTLSNSTDLGRGDVSISVNGQKTTSNSVRINGVDANSIGTNSTPNLAVPATDTLQEFIVQTSLYDASSGRNAGGNIEAVTRSGSNDFRGGAYYFLRPRALAANEPFIKGRGLDRPEFSRHQFGGLLGGPIVKDRFFFFGSYQHSRERNGYSLLNSLTSPVIPTGLRDDNRTSAGIQATFGIIPNPIALNFLNARLPDGSFAIPSSGVASTTTPFASVTVPQSGISRFRENQFNANFDFIFTDKHSLAAKFFVADNPTFQANYNFAGLGNGDIQLIGFGGDLTIKQKLYSVTDTYVFSSNVVNQARFGFSRLRVTSVPEEPFTAAQLGITGSLTSIYPGAPTIRVLGADSQFFFGSSPLADQSSRINGYSFGDTLSVTMGNHRLRVGAEFKSSTIKFYFNAFSRGQILFSNFTNFLTGTGTSLLGSGVFDRSFRVKDWSGFVQDDWKIHPRLTVNFGLRYDLYGLPAEDQGRLVNFLPNQAVIGTPGSPAPPPNGFVQAEGGSLAGVPFVEKTLVPTDKNNFAPRIGFAFVLDEKSNLVVRGGYGIYYDRFSTRFANTQLFNYPYFALGVGLPGILRTFADPFIPMPAPSTFPTAATIPSPLSPLSPLVGVPIAGIFVDPELQTPYVEQYNIGLQWQLGKNFVWDVGYVGNRGRHIMQVVSLNQPIYNPATNAFTTRWPTSIISGNKNVTGGVQQLQTTSLSSYNSLQTSLSKRFSSGLQFLAAYTFGKAIDYYGSLNQLNEIGNVPGDQVNWRTNRGRSDFNREQRFVFSGAYDVPWKFESGIGKAVLNDWQFAGIVVLQSGQPFSVVADNGTSTISRANFNRSFNGSIYSTGNVSDRVGGYFNPGVFVPPCLNLACSAAVGPVTNIANFDPSAPFGNTPRNGFTGPGQKNVDISFIKFIPFGERFKGELRAEFFNVFNWVNYANPNNNLIGAKFGQIVRASSGPRVIQLGFKLSF